MLSRFSLFDSRNFHKFNSFSLSKFWEIFHACECEALLRRKILCINSADRKYFFTASSFIISWVFIFWVFKTIIIQERNSYYCNFTLALEVHSHFSLRLNRRVNQAPFSENTFTPVKKISSSRFEIAPSEKSSSKFPYSCKLLSIFYQHLLMIQLPRTNHLKIKKWSLRLSSVKKSLK